MRYVDVMLHKVSLQAGNSDAVFVENDSTQNTSIQGTEVNLIGFNVYVGSSSVSLGSLGYYTFFVTTSHMFYS